MKCKKVRTSIIDSMTHWNQNIDRDKHSILRKNISHSILTHLFVDEHFKTYGSCVVSLTADQLKEVK